MQRWARALISRKMSKATARSITHSRCQWQQLAAQLTSKQAVSSSSKQSTSIRWWVVMWTGQADQRSKAKQGRCSHSCINVTPLLFHWLVETIPRRRLFPQPDSSIIAKVDCSLKSTISQAWWLIRIKTWSHLSPKARPQLRVFQRMYPPSAYRAEKEEQQTESTTSRPDKSQQNRQYLAKSMVIWVLTTAWTVRLTVDKTLKSQLARVTCRISLHLSRSPIWGHQDMPRSAMKKTRRRWQDSRRQPITSLTRIFKISIIKIMTLPQSAWSTIRPAS